MGKPWITLESDRNNVINSSICRAYVVRNCHVIKFAFLIDMPNFILPNEGYRAECNSSGPDRGNLIRLRPGKVN